MQCLSNGQRTDESIFLFNIACHSSKRPTRWIAAIDQGDSFNASSGSCISMSQNIQKRGLSTSTRPHQSTYFSFQLISTVHGEQIRGLHYLL